MRPDCAVETRLSFEDIESARARIADAVYKTPFPRAEKISEMSDRQVFLKLENLQLTGSFKERGAANCLRKLSADGRVTHVVAASAGNHAQAVALHASKLGMQATIVMPEATPLVKISRTRKLGAAVVLHGASYDDAYERAKELVSDSTTAFVHAFDNLDVMAGQGTIGLEILEQNPYIQTLLVPVGGGGLIAGVATAIKETNPKIQIIGVESVAFPSLAASFDAQSPVAVDPTISIADGIAVKAVGSQALPLIQRYVDDVITVTEEEIANAILTLLEDEKVVAEGAAAVGVAAILNDKLPTGRCARVGAVVSGGNIDINVVSQIIERGLVKGGRRVRLEVEIPDVPGGLAALTKILGDHRANVLEIHHDRAFTGMQLGVTDVMVTLETRGFDHIHAIIQALQAAGYTAAVE